MLAQNRGTFIYIRKIAWGIGKQSLFILCQRDGWDRFLFFIDPLLVTLQFFQFCNGRTDMGVIIGSLAVKFCLKRGNFALQIFITLLFLRPGFGFPLDFCLQISFLPRQITMLFLAILQTPDSWFRSCRAILFLCSQFSLQSVQLSFQFSEALCFAGPGLAFALDIARLRFTLVEQVLNGRTGINCCLQLINETGGSFSSGMDQLILFRRLWKSGIGSARSNDALNLAIDALYFIKLSRRRQCAAMLFD